MKTLTRSAGGSFALSALALSLAAHAAQTEQFNTQFVHGTQNISAVNDIALNDGLSEGTFEYDIYLDGQLVSTRSVTFKKSTQEGRPQPCLSAEDLRSFGVNLPATETAQCIDLAARIPHSSVHADSNYQRIDLSVPDANLTVSAKDAIPASAYDEGINAAWLGYDANATHFTDESTTNNALWLGLKNGVNLGGWHFRNQSALTQNTRQGYHWQTQASWAERNIVSLRSRLQLGQTATGDEVFDSIQFVGAQLTSDDNMLPDSLRGFAPEVRGIANSNATVEIRQNGYLIYSKNVAPGPFVIHDLTGSNDSGDLLVTVIEANGSARHFSVPWSSVPDMLRAGNSHFQLTAGEYRNGYDSWQPHFAQGTLGYGFSTGTTAYAGLLAADDYRALAMGLGQDLHQFGAVSFDITAATAQLASGEKSSGQSFRFLYAKSLNELGTQFRLVGYRYNTEGFYSLSDLVSEHDTWHDGYYDIHYDDPTQKLRYAGQEKRYQHYYTAHFNNRRQRLEASISQQLWENASLYLSASNQSYWGNGSLDRSWQVGYSDLFGHVSCNVYFQETRSQYGYADNSVNLNLSVPLDFGEHTGNLSLSVSQDRQNGGSYATSYSSNALDNQLSWGVQAATDDKRSSSAGINAGWQGEVAAIDGSYSAGTGFQSLSAGARGGVMLHSGGLTLMPSPGDTMVLVEAKNAQGVHVEPGNNTAIDSHGYAVVPYANAWHYNTISLNTADIGAGLDIPLAAKRIVPQDGAVSRVTFETFTGRNYLITAVMNGNALPPVGASVLGHDGRNHGLVGMNGAMYVSGVASQEKLEVRWGSRRSEHCFIQMPDTTHKPLKNKGYERLAAQCRAV